MTPIQINYLDALAEARKHNKTLGSFSKNCRENLVDKYLGHSCQCWRCLARCGIAATPTTESISKADAISVDSIKEQMLIQGKAIAF